MPPAELVGEAESRQERQELRRGADSYKNLVFPEERRGDELTARRRWIPRRTLPCNATRTVLTVLKRVNCVPQAHGSVVDLPLEYSPMVYQSVDRQ